MLRRRIPIQFCAPKRLATVVFAVIAVGALAGCATVPTDPAERAAFEQENDPLEPLNRAVFSFNNFFDKLLLKPAATIYGETLPDPVKDGVHNFLSNLRAPIVLANDLLQGNLDRAGNTASRFVINSTVGVLGVWDAASHFGIDGHSEDFGQTFAVWGIGEGPYLVLPILGPSNPRDAAGLVTEWYTDPFDMLARNNDESGLVYARGGTTAVDYRARNMDFLEQLERTSLDYYVAIRSLYRQRRAAEIRNGRETADTLSPGLGTAPETGTQ